MDDVLDRLCNLWSSGINCGPNYELLVRYKAKKICLLVIISAGCHFTLRLKSCSFYTWCPLPRGAPPPSTVPGSIPPSLKTRRRLTSPSISSNQKPSKQSNNGSQLVCKGSVSSNGSFFFTFISNSNKTKIEQKKGSIKQRIFTRRCRHSNRNKWRRGPDAELPEVLQHDGP